MDISNKSLALILVAAIVVSLGGTILSLNKLNEYSATGMATGDDTGTTQFTINSSVLITFTTDSIDFGTGYVNNTDGGTVQNCTMNSESTNSANCVNFNTVANGFVIQNDGNLDVNLTLKSSQNASTLFTPGDVTLRQFQWKMANVEGSSCSAGAGIATYTEVGQTDTDLNVCTVFNYEDSSDTVELDMQVMIPDDAAPGVRTATITATGTSV